MLVTGLKRKQNNTYNNNKMKTIAIVAVIGLAAAAFFAYSSTQNNEVEEAFRGFIEKYRVGYTYRLGVFEENLKRYEKLRILNPEAEFGVTQFSDSIQSSTLKNMGAWKYSVYIPS